MIRVACAVISVLQNMCHVSSEIAHAPGYVGVFVCAVYTMHIVCGADMCIHETMCLKPGTALV